MNPVLRGLCLQHGFLLWQQEKIGGDALTNFHQASHTMSFPTATTIQMPYEAYVSQTLSIWQQDNNCRNILVYRLQVK